MRWFKHFTDAQRDESLQELRDIHGWQGYGMYWALLEIIAEQIDGGDEAEVTLPLKQLARNFGTYPKHLQKILQTLADLSLIFSHSFEKESRFFVTLNCPKLLNIRDEWSKKKAKTPERLRSNSGSQEVEVDPDPDPEEYNSESKDSGGEPPSGTFQAEQPSPPPTPMNIWSVGVSLLGEQGVPERKARSFIGKLCKDHGEQAVSEAFGKALYERPADLQGWITKVCQNNGKRPQYTNPNAPDGTLKL